jgi:hypothetical protein
LRLSRDRVAWLDSACQREREDIGGLRPGPPLWSRLGPSTLQAKPRSALGSRGIDRSSCRRRVLRSPRAMARDETGELLHIRQQRVSKPAFRLGRRARRLYDDGRHRADLMPNARRRA